MKLTLVTSLCLSLILINACSTLPSVRNTNSKTTKTVIDKRWEKAVVNNETCITDLKTGLMWEVKTTGKGNRSKNNVYLWADAMKNYTKRVNATGLCGFKDWRLPTTKEFISIIDCGNGKIRDSMNLACGNINKKEKYPKYKSPTINKKLFPNTMIGSYWTSKTTVNDPTAEKIDFVDGHDHIGFKVQERTFMPDRFYVRLVRK